MADVALPRALEKIVGLERDLVAIKAALDAAEAKVGFFLRSLLGRARFNGGFLSLQ